jgi:adenylate cyclase
MMRPFRTGDTLEDHAVPMGDVFLQLQTQLAEFKALKEQLSIGLAGAPDPNSQIEVDLTTPAPTPRSSGANSSSSHTRLLLSSAPP